MKRYFAFLIAVAMVLVVSACFAETTEIVFWHSMSENAGVLTEQFVQEFNDTVGAEKGIHVTAVYQGAYSDATQKLQAALQSGDAANQLPDVMQCDATGKTIYLASGYAYTVDEAAASNNYDLTQIVPIALANWNMQGKQLGLPYATSTTVTYYNKSLFDQAGISVPTTFAEVAAAAAVLPKENENGQSVYVMAGIPNTPTLANWLGQLGSYTVDNENGSIARAQKLDCIENGALQTFLTEWKNMYDSGALLNVGNGLTDMFVAGQIAMLSTSSSNIASVLDAVGDKFEVGIAPYTRVNDTATNGATPSGSALFMFECNRGNNAAAWEFVTYMASAEIQAKLAAGTGYIASNTLSGETETMKALLAESPIYAAPMEQLNTTPASMKSVTVGPSADFYYGIINCVSDMLEQNMTVEETVEIMTDELNGLLEEYNAANP